MAREQKDYYYRLAKQEGYRARSAYKLQQVNGIILESKGTVDPDAFNCLLSKLLKE